MPDSPQAAPTSPSTPAQSDRDVQRSALRDLVALSAESAATEQEIEKRHRAQLQAAERQLENALTEIEQRFEQQKQQLSAEYDGPEIAR
jgi:hypothetical protein